MAWEIEWTAKAHSSLCALPEKERNRIVRFLRTQVADQDNPRRMGMALKSSEFKGLWRYRIGDYRLLCNIDDENICVVIVKIGRRDHIYDR